MTQKLTQQEEVSTSEGKWEKARTSTAFTFCWIPDKENPEIKQKLRSAFVEGQQLDKKINNALKRMNAKNGLYLAHEKEMIKALNSIDGLNQHDNNTIRKKGSKTTVEITKEFFKMVLAGLQGNVSSIEKFLTEEMKSLHVTAGENHEAQKMGILLILISVKCGMPNIDVKYVYVSEEFKDWFVKTPCHTIEKQSYNMEYTYVNFSYNPAEK